MSYENGDVKMTVLGFQGVRVYGRGSKLVAAADRKSAVSLLVLCSCLSTVSARRWSSRRPTAETVRALSHNSAGFWGVCPGCWAVCPNLVLSSLPAPLALWFSSLSPPALP